ncbi:MAG: MFS transporter [Anaerolineae bacterium]|nr:MFS transporter [Anaerolineae bacterium]MDW8071418.1 MFS transporter [Anaerolineae bacterium]
MSIRAETLASTEERRFQADQVITIAAAHAAHDMYAAFLPALLPALITKLALPTAQAGTLVLFLQWPSLLQPVIGHLADRISLRYLVIVAPAVTATMMSWLGWAPDYAVMAMMLSLVGFSSASLHAVSPVIAGQLSGRQLGRGMGLWMVGGELGYMIGPIIAVTVIRFTGLNGVAWLMLFGLIASVILSLRLRNLPAQPSNLARPLPWREALRAMSGIMKLLAGIVILRAFIIAALVTYLPTFLTREGTDLWLAGTSLSIFQMGSIAGAWLGGPSSDRWGRHTVLWISLTATAVLMALFLITTQGARLVCLLLLGVSVAGTFPVLLALAQEALPSNRALANGIYMAITFAMESIAVISIGVVGDWVGLRIAYIAIVAAPLLCLPLVAQLPSEKRRV